MTHDADDPALTYVSDIVKVLASTNQYEKVLHLVIDRLVRLHHAQTCAIVLIDPSTEYLSIENSAGLSHLFCKGFRRSIATSAIGKLLWTGAPLVIESAGRQPEIASEVQLERPFASCVCMQISIDHRTLGYMHLDTAAERTFSEADLTLLGIFAAVSGLAIVKARLYEDNLRLDRIDHETGVEKYLPFLERLRVEVERARTSREHLAVVLLDVDNYKMMANTYGFDAARDVLRQMGAVTSSLLRPIDAIGRYGFDEFIVMLTGTSLQKATLLADQIRRAIQHTDFTSQHIHSTVSVGLSVFPESGETVDDLVQSAKGAVFEAQRAGRNSVYWYRTTEA